ncbi:MAG: ParA family protein [Gomphosphaeria aponina SAG 52.96 = DSM 107014]|uniref:ParA family protein n=1 Tax=Gomphosphaeria aponina SAG 52.96 = DSM 107014 TaxID=1521640 RepID=A0A941GU80_9CHRO|nr:ParA family protein [Gomphosphaeria aponina SAG 52.96 = DSM 107014]
MTSYAFWNNKGGVGKSFLCFVAASEYAHLHQDTDVYVIDLCPQGNVSETLLGGYLHGSKALNSLLHKTPRKTVAGYLEARLNSPFQMIPEIAQYLCEPKEFNPSLPENLKLVCGDNLLEIISEAIRQTSQLSIPINSWKQVITWIYDLTVALRNHSGERKTMFVIDCNPSFAVYTQLALVAAESVVIPFTADDSSRRAIENVVALLYGLTDTQTQTYARISFAKRAKEEGIPVPKLNTFVSNRMTFDNGKPSKAFEAVNKTIKKTMDDIYNKNNHIFSYPKDLPSKNFIEIPDYHSVCVVASHSGTPLHKLKPGPQQITDERLQLNPDPLDRYRHALQELVNCL